MTRLGGRTPFWTTRSPNPTGKAREPAPLPMDANEKFLENREVHLRAERLRSASCRWYQGAQFSGPCDTANRLQRVCTPRWASIRKAPRCALRPAAFRSDQPSGGRSPFYEHAPWRAETASRPLRFGFFGTVRSNKGLEVLVRAIDLLESEIRKRCQFVIRARRRLGLPQTHGKYPEVNFLGGYDCSNSSRRAANTTWAFCRTSGWTTHPGHVGASARGEDDHRRSTRRGRRHDHAAGQPARPPGNGLFFPGGQPEKLAEAFRSLSGVSLRSHRRAMSTRPPNSRATRST